MSVLIAGSLGGVLILAVMVWWKKSNTEPSNESFADKDAPKDVVVLQQLGKGLTVPSISPFVMKLETYLRAANIPYVSRYDRKMGPKGKVPWIQYNNDVISDSQTVIEYLNQRFDVDLNKGLTNHQRALGHMTRRMAEEWVYNILMVFRLQFDPNGTLYKRLGVNALKIWFIRRTSVSRAWGQGIGRHSRPEVETMMEHDLTAIELILGDKTYLLGESITEYDCALFGQLCELSWQMPGTGIEEIIQEKYPKLVDYCQRIKEKVWPDWDQLLLFSTLSESKQKQESSSTKED